MPPRGHSASGLRLPPGVEGKALIAAQHLPPKSGRTLIAAGAFTGEGAVVIIAAATQDTDSPERSAVFPLLQVNEKRPCHATGWWRGNFQPGRTK